MTTYEARWNCHALLWTIFVVIGIGFGSAVVVAPKVLLVLLLLPVVWISIIKPGWFVAIVLVSSPFIDQFGLRPFLGTIDAAGVVRGALLLIILFSALVLRFNIFLVDKVSRRFSVFLGVVMLSSAVSIAPAISMKTALALSFWVIFFLYVRELLRNRDVGDILRWAFIVASIGIIGSMVPYELNHIYAPYHVGVLSIYGRYAGPFNLALSSGFLLSAFALMKTRVQKVIFLIGAIFLFDIVVNTYVRTSLVIIVAMVGGLVADLRAYKLSNLGAMAAGVVVAAFAFHKQIAGWAFRLSLGASLNALTSGRLEIYQVALRVFSNLSLFRQLAGVGFGATYLLIDTSLGVHVGTQNDFLGLLLGTGVIGLGLFFWVMATLVQEIIRSNTHIIIRLSILAAIIMVAFINGVIVNETTAMVFALAIMESYGSVPGSTER